MRTSLGFLSLQEHHSMNNFQDEAVPEFVSQFIIRYLDVASFPLIS